MKYPKAIGWTVGVYLLLAGCSNAPAPSTGTWAAQPEGVDVETPSFKVTMEPKKGDNPYYAFFLVTVTNKEKSNIVVDWNKSRYLFNGKSQGVLVFEGIDPHAIKSATVSPDVISPGAVYAKEIMPHRLIAWRPVKEKSVDGRSILPGIFPEGENGVLLVMQGKGEEVAIPLSVRITKESVK